MSDLSDPTALPKRLRAWAAEHECTEISNMFGGYLCSCGQNWAYPLFPLGCVQRTAIVEAADVIESQAAELDGLRAQIEEAQALRNKPGAHKEHVLAVFDESPRGTVARIQAKAWSEGYSHCFECPDPGTSLDDNPYTEESQND